MTFILFNQHADSALIVSDTLTSTRDGSPWRFSTKVLAFPHLNMAMCVMGSSDFGRVWENFLHIGLVGAADIERLNTAAPTVLRELWATSPHEPNEDVRICHIGFPSGSDRIVRYTYESKTNFEPELFDSPGLWMQPLPQRFAIERPLQQINDYVGLVTRIREERAWGADMVGIGGEIHATVISNWSIHTTRWHRFDDHDEMAAAMLTHESSRATQPMRPGTRPR